MKAFYLQSEDYPITITGHKRCWIVVLSDWELRTASFLIGLLAVCQALNCCFWLGYLSADWSHSMMVMRLMMNWARRYTNVALDAAEFFAEGILRGTSHLLRLVLSSGV